MAWITAMGWRTRRSAVAAPPAAPPPASLSVSLFAGLDDRLAAYADQMEFLPTSIRDFPFRNGYFYKYSLMAGVRTNAAGMRIEMPDTTPLHTEYLLDARDEGIVSQELLDSVKPEQ